MTVRDTGRRRPTWLCYRSRGIFGAPVKAAIFTALLLALFPLPAAAQSACGPHDLVTERLTNKFREQRIAVAIANDGSLLEIFVSQTGSFSVVKTMPGGRSCLVDAGESWQGGVTPAARQSAEGDEGL
jgi:hypothetical protein